MNIRRKNRLWIACAVLAGLALTIGLVLYWHWRLGHIRPLAASGTRSAGSVS